MTQSNEEEKCIRYYERVGWRFYKSDSVLKISPQKVPDISPSKRYFEKMGQLISYETAYEFWNEKR